MGEVDDMMDETALTAPATAKERSADLPDEPAAGGRLLLGWILIAASVVMLIAGWVGVSANPQVAVQLSFFFSGGLGGLLAGIIGIGLLVSDDIRRDRARIGKLEATVLEMREVMLAQADLLRSIEGSLEQTEAEQKPKPRARRSGAARR